MKHMHHLKTVGLISILCVGAASAAFVLHGPAATSQEETRPLVRLADVQRMDKPASRSFAGVADSPYAADLSFRVSGRITERLVNDGERVKAGQILFRLDSTDLQLTAGAAQAQAAAAETGIALAGRQSAALANQIIGAEAAIRSASARLDLARTERARMVELVAGGAAGTTELDRLNAEFKSAEAGLEAAQAQAAAIRQQSGAANEQVSQARAQANGAQKQAAIAANQAGYSVVRASSDGIVTAIFAQPGQVVAAGQPIARIARGGGVEAVVALPEDFAFLRPGAMAEVMLTGRTVPVPVRLREISGAADPITRTFKARFELPKDVSVPLGISLQVMVNELPPGDSSAGEAKVGKVDAKFTVPMSALFDGQNGSGVWVFDAKNSKVVWRPVKIAGFGDDTALVSAGLSSGERVVALGVHLLTNNQAVRVTEISKK